MELYGECRSAALEPGKKGALAYGVGVAPARLQQVSLLRSGPLTGSKTARW